MVTLKRANQVPLPHSASSLSLQPTAASPFPSQHPSGGEGASPAPRLIWPWQLESRALYWPQPSPKGYIQIPTPRWMGSANRFGMSARLAELNEPHTYRRGCYMLSKTLQMNLELQLKEHLISQQAFVLNNLDIFFLPLKFNSDVDFETYGMLPLH